ncbi:hypothetical protein [Streptomyces virginiae]|uniref:hypothetical protein n=1 Tax=Streptomyces virginiae TaxID=1961 RepID=UPI003864835E|nr:hypothetical protein OG253_40210 [Streptomyces virginiae]
MPGDRTAKAATAPVWLPADPLRRTLAAARACYERHVTPATPPHATALGVAAWRWGSG